MIYYFVLTEKTADVLAQNGFLLFQRKEALKLKLNQPFYFTEKTMVGQFSKLLSGTNIFSLGHYSYSWSSLPINTVVGNYCSIAAQVVKRGLDHPYERFTTSAITYERDYPPANKSQIQKCAIPAKSSQIVIENDVWVGAYAMLKPGITLHNGSIIAARANVTKDVPPYAIVGGNPAKVIKMRFDEDIIEKLLATRWFEYDIPKLDFQSDIEIESFIDFFYDSLDKGLVKKLEDVSLMSLLTLLEIPYHPK